MFTKENPKITSECEWGREGESEVVKRGERRGRKRERVGLKLPSLVRKYARRCGCCNASAAAEDDDDDDDDDDGEDPPQVK